jgi:oligopeptide/dipeptide ABC transporter ATP-binding protein
MADRSAGSPLDDRAPVLEVDGLCTEFHLRKANVRAVDGISFSVGAGECVGLVGESGCGKSTAGLSIMKLLPSVGHVTAGRVELLGRDIVPLGESDMQKVRGNEVGMIFQDPMTSLNPTWTIGRQIAEPVVLHRGASRKEARERALEVLNLVGMPRPAERLDYYPHQLSGGLRQRVMIAMALACEPKLLIADEPTTALDVTIQAQILDLIDELRERLKMAVILITHDMGVIAARTSHVMVMYAGKIIEAAPTTQLFASMRHPYSEALFESIPRLDQDRSRPLFSIPGLPPDLSHPPTGCRFRARCRYATDVCASDEPPLTDAGERADTDHRYACFHPVGLANAAGVVTRAAAAEWVGDEQTGSTGILVELDHVVKEYPVSSGAIFTRQRGSVHAVSDVSFAVREGETFGLVGESGCGKTTIGRLVVALERPTSGAIRFAGEDLASLKGAPLRSRRRDLQLMFQDPYSSLDPRMRVGSIVEEPLVVQKIGNRSERRKRVEQLLDEVGLPRRATELYPHEFSGGQRQRIGFARALALQPRLIVADEPVSALDVSIQAQILNLMRSLQREHNLAYIVISHDLAVVRYLATRIGVMYLGKLVEVGPADDVYRRAAHPYTQGLIDTIPVPDPAVAHGRRGQAVRGELPSAIDPPSGCRFRTRCPLAQQICAEKEPPMQSFGSGHGAACHFPLQTPIDEPVELSTSAS